jgi:Flp pilus assembly pilin Flp
MMNSRRKGQGLIEYALILVLVAVVVIFVTALMGQSAQRIMGLVAAMLGTKHGSENLEILYTECYVHTGAGARTGIWVRGKTSYPVTELIGSTEKNFGGTIAPNDVGPGPTGPGTFKYQVTLDSTSGNAGVCPRGVVIQSKNGDIAVWPVQPHVAP